MKKEPGSGDMKQSSAWRRTRGKILLSLYRPDLRKERHASPLQMPSTFVLFASVLAVVVTIACFHVANSALISSLRADLSRGFPPENPLASTRDAFDSWRRLAFDFAHSADPKVLADFEKIEPNSMQSAVVDMLVSALGGPEQRSTSSVAPPDSIRFNVDTLSKFLKKFEAYSIQDYDDSPETAFSTLTVPLWASSDAARDELVGAYVTRLGPRSTLGLQELKPFFPVVGSDPNQNLYRVKRDAGAQKLRNHPRRT